MKPAARAALVFMVFFGTYALTWLLILLLPLGSLDWYGGVIALIAAIAVARYTRVHYSGAGWCAGRQLRSVSLPTPEFPLCNRVCCSPLSH